jgi:hypothetical protein
MGAQEVLAEILIALPEEHLRRALAQRLEYRGHLVHRAGSQSDALAILRSTRVDLVVTSHVGGCLLAAMGHEAAALCLRLEPGELSRIEQGWRANDDPLQTIIDRIEVALRKHRGFA